MELQALIHQLSQPGLYPRAPRRVELRQTHASCVFLTDDEAYKLKKPVNLGFLDYSTLERRHEMCEREVALNRRLAPSVYLGVVPLVSDHGELHIGDEGEVVDWLVRMRRLDDDSRLEAMIQRGAAGVSEMRRIAEVIAKFHAGAERSESIRRHGEPEAVAWNVAENWRQIAPFAGQTVDEEHLQTIRRSSERFLADHWDLLASRARRGFVADCHGDLRADHVYFEGDAVQVIDCIEFNDRYRCQDVASDVAFLAMDIERLGRPDFAEAFVERYRELAPDAIYDILDFYRCYRAVVRGKVSSIASAEPELGDEARQAATIDALRSFDLARRFATGASAPILLAMCGLTGTGKSTLAARLAQALGAEVVSADQVRKEIAGIAPRTRVVAAIDTAIYSPEMNARVYHQLAESADCLLRSGRNVVLDATYRRAADRANLLDLARQARARFLLVECQASPETVRTRLDRREAARDAISDGRWEVYLAQAATAEPPTELADRERIAVDTEEPLVTQALHVVRAVLSPDLMPLRA